MGPLSRFPRLSAGGIPERSWVCSRAGCRGAEPGSAESERTAGGALAGGRPAGDRSHRGWGIRVRGKGRIFAWLRVCLDKTAVSRFTLPRCGQLPLKKLRLICKLIDLNTEGGIGANSLFLRMGAFKVLIDAGHQPEESGIFASLPDFSVLRGGGARLCAADALSSRSPGGAPDYSARAPGGAGAHVGSEPEPVGAHAAQLVQRDETPARGAQSPGTAAVYASRDRYRDRAVFSDDLRADQRFRQAATRRLAITFFPAGHVAGAGGVEIVHNDKKIFLTGDVLVHPAEDSAGSALSRTPRGHSRHGDDSRGPRNGPKGSIARPKWPVCWKRSPR
jgi:hypothetical protein